jgi:hypothetical protein
MNGGDYSKIEIACAYSTIGRHSLKRGCFLVYLTNEKFVGEGFFQS